MKTKTLKLVKGNSESTDNISVISVTLLYSFPCESSVFVLFREIILR